VEAFLDCSYGSLDGGSQADRRITAAWFSNGSLRYFILNVNRSPQVQVIQDKIISGG
jgi:hypothetical protein